MMSTISFLAGLFPVAISSLLMATILQQLASQSHKRLHADSELYQTQFKK